MFNTQIYIGPDGRIIGKHQKLVPTVGERLVHMGGFGDTFGAFQTEFGPMSGLICGENSNPLAVFALTAEGTRIHVMSWPNHFPTSGDPMRNRVSVDSQAFAQMSKAFVVSACGTVDEKMIEVLRVGPEAEKFLRNPDCCGGSVIVAPNSHIIAGPMGAEEGILYADCNIELGVQMKLRHDFAGHYNRPDIFHVQINRSLPKIYTVQKDADVPVLQAPRDERPLLPATTSVLERPAGGDLLAQRRVPKNRSKAKGAARGRTRRKPGGA
jgi:aliphatic nitrilase